MNQSTNPQLTLRTARREWLAALQSSDDTLWYDAACRYSQAIELAQNTLADLDFARAQAALMHAMDSIPEGALFM
jgi:hypothetical protein